MSTAIGHGLAKVLGIKLNNTNNENFDPVSRGESVFSVSSADTYVEEEPTSAEWLREIMPTGQQMRNYFAGLFPFIHWIGRYNMTWLYGDLVAGITVGAVVVPQSMAYAKLANLDPEFGLYSAFMGVLIYWIFATSKDITIGPVAVMSQVTGGILLQVAGVLPQYEGYQVAEALAIICGAIVCFMGLIRIGWIVEFISLTAVTAFITGAAINILCGQVPTMMGISKAYVNTRASTYLVIINTLKHLGRTQLDAAIGLTALFMLYAIRAIFTFLSKKSPKKARWYFFASTLRTAFVILLYTLISWLVNRKVAANKNSKSYTKAHWAILGPVPRGFKYAHVPTVNTEIISAFASKIPAAVIVLLIEHIAIAKSFGRVNNYIINPSQELLAIGVTNLLAPFLGAYPATGSFSRTAIKSKAGVRTPFAGVITAIVVLLAIYALPAVFYWIPNAVLAAVIIHAVGDLVASPNTIYQFWRISPLEVIIFFAGVIVTVFSSIEDGIYTTICVSIALLLFRLAKARGRFLGKVTIHSVVGDHILEEAKAKGDLSVVQRQRKGQEDETHQRTIYLPFAHEDGSNPSVELSAPYPGVFIYRFSEGYNYPNANHYLDHMVHEIFRQTRKTNPNDGLKPGDRPWNNPGPRRGKVEEVDYSKPTLKAVILDFSSVNNVDVTSVQQLIDVRNQLDRYASPNVVDWHIACINNRWTKRALASAGFGLPPVISVTGEFSRWKPIFSVAEMGGQDSAAAAAEASFNDRRRTLDIESASINRSESRESSAEGLDAKIESELDRPNKSGKIAIIQGLNRPNFHIDITSAVQSAIATVEASQQ